MRSMAPVPAAKQKGRPEETRVGPYIGRKLDFGTSVSQRFTRLRAALQPLHCAKSRHLVAVTLLTVNPVTKSCQHPILVESLLAADGRWISSGLKSLVRELLRPDGHPPSWCSPKPQSALPAPWRSLMWVDATIGKLRRLNAKLRQVQLNPGARPSTPTHLGTCSL